MLSKASIASNRGTGTGKQKGAKGKNRWRSWRWNELKLAPGLRLLGLDLGEKTIGLALSDTGLSIATPMQTLKRGKFAADAARLDIIISAQGVGGLVVGLPLNMDGSDGPRAQSARAFGRNWGARSPCPWYSRMSGFPPAP